MTGTPSCKGSVAGGIQRGRRVRRWSAPTFGPCGPRVPSPTNCLDALNGLSFLFESSRCFPHLKSPEPPPEGAVEVDVPAPPRGEEKNCELEELDQVKQYDARLRRQREQVSAERRNGRPRVARNIASGRVSVSAEKDSLRTLLSFVSFLSVKRTPQMASAGANGTHGTDYM